MIMRKNKTYEQQKKYYDEYNDYESLGAIFMYWLEMRQRDPAQMQETYRECNRECKEFIWEDLYHLCNKETFDKETFYKFV